MSSTLDFFWGFDFKLYSLEVLIATEPILYIKDSTLLFTTSTVSFYCAPNLFNYSHSLTNSPSLKNLQFKPHLFLRDDSLVRSSDTGLFCYKDFSQQFWPFKSSNVPKLTKRISDNNITMNLSHKKNALEVGYYNLPRSKLMEPDTLYKLNLKPYELFVVGHTTSALDSRIFGALNGYEVDIHQVLWPKFKN